MDKKTALRLLKDLNISIDSPNYEIEEETFLIILKNYMRVE